jgi:hypothetical protein
LQTKINIFCLTNCDSIEEYDNMDWTLDDEYVAKFSGTDTPLPTREDSRKYMDNLCAYARGKGVKCMAKNVGSSGGFGGFDGMTVESYKGDTGWWNAGDLQKMLDEGKKGIIVHYGEKNAAACDAQLVKFKAKYGNNLSFICSDNKGYNHY